MISILKYRFNWVQHETQTSDPHARVAYCSAFVIIRRVFADKTCR